MAHILAVDDEDYVLDLVKEILEKSGYAVSVALNGNSALEMLRNEVFDLLITDVVMPEMNGIELCQNVRSDPMLARIPILFLTAKGRASDVVGGLDAGGDDYVVKPHDVIELPARVRALLRRAPNNPLSAETEFVEYGGLKVSVTRPEASFDDQGLSLTGTEHHLLYYLMMRAGRPATTEQCLQDVWGYPPGVGDPQLVRVHANNLRSRLRQVGCEYLQNIHGKGYLIST
jgi:two-component system alkaline phosphatase synthesis response regulator PhoP